MKLSVLRFIDLVRDRFRVEHRRRYVKPVIKTLYSDVNKPYHARLSDGFRLLRARGDMEDR